MSSDKHCCVPGCKEGEGMHKVLHGFPNPENERQRFNTWLYAIGGDILGLENERIFKYRRVCHSHFEEKYLCRNNRISNIAVPTLNMPEQTPPKSVKRSNETLENEGQRKSRQLYTKSISVKEQAASKSQQGKKVLMEQSQNGGDQITLHSFPNPDKEPDRFRSWIYAVKADILALDNKVMYEKRRICHNHFETKYRTWTKTLSPNAIPTLHLPDKQLSVLSPPDDVVTEGDGDDNDYSAHRTSSGKQLSFLSPPDDVINVGDGDDDNDYSAHQTRSDKQLSFLSPLENVVNEVDSDDDNDYSAHHTQSDETTEQTQVETYVHKNIVCNECENEIVGFRYVCVQCADCDICSACEARQAHRDHYVLRVPGPRPHWEVSQILQRVREEIAHVLNTNDPNTEPEIIKPEIKEEPEPDPLDADPDLRPHDSNILEQTILNIEDVAKDVSESQCLEEWLEDDIIVTPTEQVLAVKSHATKRGRAGEGEGEIESGRESEGERESSPVSPHPHTRSLLIPITKQYTKRRKVFQVSTSAVVSSNQDTSKDDGGSCSYEVFTQSAYPADKQTTRTTRASLKTAEAVKKKQSR